MSTPIPPFGPRLIGETEKTLNALLGRALTGTGLTEAQWVTLRIAGSRSPDQYADPSDGLATEVRRRAHFADAVELVSSLADRGLLDGGTLGSQGEALVAEVQHRIGLLTEPIWRDLPAEDVAAAERVLGTVLARARAAVA